MEKTLTIAGKDVKLNNNIGWMFIYRDQFGHDIIPALMPISAAIIDVLSGIVQESGKVENIEVADLLKVADSDKIIDAVAHLSGLELVEFINIVWALAKCADETIEEPKRWVRQFDEFPIDEIAPEVVPMIAKGVVSTKNLERLTSIQPKKRTKKSTSTKSSLQASKED